MAVWNIGNAVATTLNAGLGSVAQGTVDYVTPASKVGFPTSGQFPILVESEIMWVTNPTYSASQWQVLRGQEGTTAPAHVSGLTLTNPWTAGMLTGAFSRTDGSAPAAADQWGVKLNPAVTDAGGFGVGVDVYPTITAAANNDKLIAESIGVSAAGQSPVFATGAFTGLNIYGAYIDGSVWSKTGTGTIAAGIGLYVVAPTLGTNNLAGYFSGVLAHTTPHKARAHLNAAQTVGAGVGYLKVLLDTKDYDPNTNFDVVTNNRWTCPRTGYYQIHANTLCVTASQNSRFLTILRKNGTDAAYGTESAGDTSNVSSHVSDILQFNAGDYLELWVYWNGAAASLSTGANTYLSVHYMSD